MKLSQAILFRAIDLLPNSKSFHLYHFKAVAEIRLQVVQVMKPDPGRLEDIVLKGKLVVTFIFSFARNVFKKGFLICVFKTLDYVMIS